MRETATVSATAAMLAVEGLNAWYGELHVLHGASLQVRQGEVVTLLGRNGAGKTTTLKSIMGRLRAARLHRFRRQGDPRPRPHQGGAPRHRVLSGGEGHLRDA